MHKKKTQKKTKQNKKKKKKKKKKNRLQPDTREHLQIMNTTGSGVHWSTFSTLRANSGVVNILYDSASQPGNLRFAVENATAKHTSTKVLTFHFRECQQEENTKDCELFAISNTTELAFNGNPSTVRYEKGEIMWFHLIAGFAVKQTDPFPRSGILEHKNKIAFSQMEPLHCSCRMPENAELCFTCRICKEWFHTVCEGFAHFSRTKVQKNQEAVLCEVSEKE